MNKIHVFLILVFMPVLAVIGQPQTGIDYQTRELKKYPGFFNFYWNETTGHVLLEIQNLDSEFLYVNSLPAGVGSNDLGLDRGQIGDNRIVKFIRSGPKIFLVQPNYSYRANSDNADERKSVEEAFAQSIIWGFKVEAEQNNHVLIDITSFLLRDSHHLAEKLKANDQGNFEVDESRSGLYLPNTRNFPQNSEFESIITLTGKAKGQEIISVTPDPGAVTVRMHHSFIQLPDGNYKIRKFDPRSGLYGINFMDFATPIDEPIVKRLLTRHRLQKKDPLAAMSEPIKPIVYYVDRGAPEPVRSALIEGASWWNEAFEAAGYKNAFKVELLPADADPMDIRYNIIQWVHRSTRGWSYGESIVDPRTGEIIKGQVSLGSLRDRQDFLIAEGLLQPYEDGKPVSDKMLKLALDRLHQLAAHEVGHTLGLQHNFASSINDRASVMDYPQPYVTLNTDGTVDVSKAYTKSIGAWDKRAILFGYQDFAAGVNEDEALKGIVNETIKQGLLYITDEDSRPAGSAHPQAHLWDNGINAADELNRMMDIRKQVLNNFSEKAIRQDAPLATLEEVLVPMYLLHRYQVEAASKMIGGLYYTYALKNDGQVITKFVSPAEQWKAFEALMGTLSPEALALPEKLLEKIPPRPVNYPRTRETFKSHTGLTFDPMAAAESAAGATLSFLLQPERAARLVEYQARDKNQPGLIPLLDSLVARTWKANQQKGYYGELQRLVNILTLNALLTLATSDETPESVKGIALLEINRLKQWMQIAVNRTQINDDGSIQGDLFRKPQPMNINKANQEASLLYGLSQIEQFEKNPGQFKPVQDIKMPDGSPIGSD